MATNSKPAAKGVEHIDTAVAAGKQTVEKAIKAAREQVEQASTATLKSYDEMSGLNKEHVSAVMASANSLSRGAEDMSKACAAFAQSSMDAYMEAGKALLSARSLNEIVDIQAELARTNMDFAIAESAKISEIGMKMLGESMQPLQAYFSDTVNAAFERVLKPAA